MKPTPEQINRWASEGEGENVQASPAEYWIARKAAAWAREQALEEAAKVCDCVNNYDNPMTADDCADAIRALKGESK